MYSWYEIFLQNIIIDILSSMLIRMIMNNRFLSLTLIGQLVFKTCRSYSFNVCSWLSEKSIYIAVVIHVRIDVLKNGEVFGVLSGIGSQINDILVNFSWLFIPFEIQMFHTCKISSGRINTFKLTVFTMIGVSDWGRIMTQDNKACDWQVFSGI